MPRSSHLPVWLLFLSVATPVTALGKITTISPRSVAPQSTVTLTIVGQGLDPSLRVLPDSSLAVAKIQSVEPTKAVVELTLEANHPLGPLALWFATAAGPVKPYRLMVDDLEPVEDNQSNHQPTAAQQIPSMCAIHGTSDTAKSDYFRIEVGDNQRVAFEMHTQALRSSMDPVLRIIDREGDSIVLADDGSTGPDFRFSHTFDSAGEYLLQIHDNRFSGGGAYYLRIGDFPIVSHPFPFAAQIGQPSTVRFVTTDGTQPKPQELSIESTSSSSNAPVATRLADGKSSAWSAVMVRNFQQIVEGDRSEADASQELELPVGISGRLSKPDETDTYLIRGGKGQVVQFDAKTRSVGCPTLLKMKLYRVVDGNEEQVAESKVSEADEWQLRYPIPDDGLYRLSVSDLLQRGGPEFGYYLEIQPASLFAVSLKADKATKRLLPLQADHGAAAIDLVIERTGYDGAVDISLDDHPAGLGLLNAQIPAKAKEHRIWIVAQADWQPNAVAPIRLRAASASDDPSTSLVSTSLVSTTALQRLLEPFVLKAWRWRRGDLQIAGVQPQDPPFEVAPAKPLQLARSQPNHAVAFKVKQKDEKSKASIAVLPRPFASESPHAAWRSSGKLDKGTLSVTYSVGKDSNPNPDQLSLNLYSEHRGQGRIDSLRFPVEWVVPVRLDLHPLQPLIVGKQATVRAEIVREGSDPQAVTLKPIDLPAGIQVPEQIDVAADQSQVEFPVTIAADADPEAIRFLTLNATTKFNGTDFSSQSKATPLELVGLPAKLEVYPPRIELVRPLDRQQVVVTGFDATGQPRDWTTDVTLKVANPEIAEIVDGSVRAKTNGETDLVCEVGGVRQIVPLIVSNVDTQVPTAFESEVLVAISKQGCNSGACHGSPSGKGGFRLSLRAFDRALDELTLIRESFGRRVNLLEPDKSLLLQKPTMQVSHGGGKKLRKSDDAYEILRRWIDEGARADPEGTPRCHQLSVFPSQKRVLSLPAGGQQLAVTAHFADQTSRDVTNLVAYSSSNTSVATVDEQGRVTAHAQGEAVILARYLEHIESVPLMFVDADPGFQWQPLPAHNYIDELVDAKLKLFQYQPSPVCDDSEFLRRVHLDVIGVLPTVEESKRFLADQDPNKRAVLIDTLLERHEYAKFWALKWGDLLRMTGAMVGDAGVFKYHRWVEESIRENMPYDQFATALVTASGSTLANPPANFYRTSTDMNESVETISQVFLGARLQCAKCHNHPFERWTQDNYYGLGAFFNRVNRRKTPRPGEMFVFVADSGEVTQPRTGKQMEPWLPQVGEVDTGQVPDRRKRFAQWLTQPDNPYFARIEANRIWSQLFARGIVDPIDDFRDSNPPSNSSLLDALAQDLVDSGYDRKHLLRTILNSRTYQASFETNRTNEGDDTYFSHQEPRLLGAEQLLDAINQTLELQETFANLPAGTHATQLPAPDIAKINFLKVFGQPDRLTVCACERIDDSNLGMAIELFNGTELHKKLHDKQNRFHANLAAGLSPEETIRNLYFASICRPPTDDEMQAALRHCKSRSDIASGIEDVCWALFNTDEFVFQH